MKLTSRSEYALLSMVYLARRQADGFVSVESIASSQKLSAKFLEQILLSLKRAKYLSSSKGQHGGYRLAKPANEISIAEIVRLFDGALAPTESASKNFYEPTPIEKEQKLLQVFKEIRDLIADKLENLTIADMC